MTPWQKWHTAGKFSTQHWLQGRKWCRHSLGITRRRKRLPSPKPTPKAKAKSQPKQEYSGHSDAPAKFQEGWVASASGSTLASVAVVKLAGMPTSARFPMQRAELAPGRIQPPDTKAHLTDLCRAICRCRWWIQLHPIRVWTHWQSSGRG